MKKFNYLLIIINILSTYSTSIPKRPANISSKNVPIKLAILLLKKMKEKNKQNKELIKKVIIENKNNIQQDRKSLQENKKNKKILNRQEKYYSKDINRKGIPNIDEIDKITQPSKKTSRPNSLYK